MGKQSKKSSKIEAGGRQRAVRAGVAQPPVICRIYPYMGRCV